MFKKQPKFYDDIDIYEEGLNILELTDDQIKSYGDFLMDFYKKIYFGSKRTDGTTKNPYNMLKGIIFAVGSKEFNNPDWKRHAASSLREIIYVWKILKRDIRNDFSNFYKNGNKLSADESDILNTILGHYEYFSAVHHNNEVGIVNSLRNLEKDSSLEINDCLREDIFLKWIKNFFENISMLISFVGKEG